MPFRYSRPEAYGPRRPRSMRGLRLSREIGPNRVIVGPAPATYRDPGTTGRRTMCRSSPRPHLTPHSATRWHLSSSPRHSASCSCLLGSFAIWDAAHQVGWPSLSCLFSAAWASVFPPSFILPAATRGRRFQHHDRNVYKLAPHEPSLPGSLSKVPVHRTLATLPGPGLGGGR